MARTWCWKSKITLSAVGHQYNVTLLEYIVTDVKLEDEDGNMVDVTASHYLNAADSSTYAIRFVQIPPADYTNLHFTFGIDGAENVFGNLTSSVDYDNMLWPMMMPMGDGTTERYHYMRFEGRYGTDGVFRVHTGPSGGNDFSIDVSIPLTMSVDDGIWNMQVVANLDQWFTQPNDWDFDDYGMIMGNPTAQNLVYENGENVFALGNVKLTK